MNRIDVINTLIRQCEYSRYLEIGCRFDECFAKVIATTKVGVDPVQGGTLRMTSDEFFALAVAPFDLIFIDGDHRHDQVFRDVSSSLRLLAPGGTIVMHDCLPPDAGYEALDYCGTTWRAFVKIRERPDLDAFTGDFDFGVGVVRVGVNPDPIRVARSMAELKFGDFVANRKAWMRPVPEDQVLARLVPVGTVGTT